jgi:undecaprenyl-diphosphatase
MNISTLIHVARREVSALVALAAAAAGVLVFLELADEVGEQETPSLDERLLLALRTGDTHDPIGPPWVEVMFTDITSLGGITVLALASLAVAGYLLLIRKPGTALLVFCSVSGGAMLNTVLKMVFERPRPDLVAHIVETQTASFPSGHAMMSAATYLTLGALLARVQSDRRSRYYVIGAAVLVTVLIGVSRVYLGVHWPSDVLAGWAAGASWAIFCWLVAVALQRSRKISDPDQEAEAVRPRAP